MVAKTLKCGSLGVLRLEGSQADRPLRFSAPSPRAVSRALDIVTLRYGKVDDGVMQYS
jgi:hypothetical protein